MPHSAIIPIAKIENDFYDWHARHAEKCAAAAQARDCRLVFLGDSITHMFELEFQGAARGAAVWREAFAPFHPLNLGFGWDRTQNVLWRLDHGEFAGLRPRWVCLLIGTNNQTATANAVANTPREIAEGVEAICRKIHGMSPDSEILLHAIFPRGAPGDSIRRSIDATNREIEALVPTLPRVRWIDLRANFLGADGTIPTALMNDLCHPTEEGYRIWARELLPRLK